MKKTLFAFAIVTLAVADAETYSVKFFHPSVVNGIELKPGEYRVDVNDGKAVISRGKQTAESAVRVETADSKFGSTSVKYQNGDGKYRLSEIRFGGSKTKLVFDN
jgi:hypothetical protein